MKHLKICEVCKKEFHARNRYGRHHGVQRFCSSPCYYKWRKGKNVSPETQFKKYSPPWNKGMTMSKEHCMKLGQSQRGVPKPNLGGSKNHFWKGGVTSKNKRLRTSMEYRVWRKNVFERDSYTCQHCGQVGGKLNADHVKPFCLFPELHFRVSNGRTLCESCHVKTDTFGRKALIYKIKIRTMESIS